jgi:hypothetical protein
VKVGGGGLECFTAPSERQGIERERDVARGLRSREAAVRAE